MNNNANKEQGHIPNPNMEKFEKIFMDNSEPSPMRKQENITVEAQPSTEHDSKEQNKSEIDRFLEANHYDKG
ncbi:MAG: hypothetical protein ABJQ37_14965 [Reichenbachiella sp.]